MQKLSRSQSYMTKNDFVYQSLRDAIMNCELKPGTRLVIQNIADQFGVSIIPVREALRLLHSEDLVTHTAHIGSIVSPISRDSIAETFTLKEGLEGVTTRIAVERMTSSHLQKLEELTRQMDMVLKNQTYEQWSALNTEFHDTFTQITEMPTVIEISKRVLDKWNRIRRYYFDHVLVHRLVSSQAEHHGIMDAVRKGDAAMAEQLAREHNRHALAGYLEYLSTQTESEDTGN